MDEKKLLKVVDQRLRNHYSDGNTDGMHKVEESITAVMRVGLSCERPYQNCMELIHLSWLVMLVSFLLYMFNLSVLTDAIYTCL